MGHKERMEQQTSNERLNNRAQLTDGSAITHALRMDIYMSYIVQSRILFFQ